MSCPTVAFDVGPMMGRRTGVGGAVAALHAALEDRDDVTLWPYLTSFRARPGEGVRRLPLPAALAHRLWARTDHPRADRWLPADVVHGTNYVVPPADLPRLVSVYDCWFLQHPDDADPDVVRCGKVLLRALADGTVAHTSSHATAEVLRALVPHADVRPVHLGPITIPPPPDVCPIPELDGADFVVAVGTIERRKNLPRLVEAFGLVARTRPQLRLVIAGGDGDDRPNVEAAIDRLVPAVARRVLLTGFVTDPVRSWLLHQAAALAYPSLDEGFGFPLLDAMQAGVPIVASSVGSIPEVAGHAAVLVSPLDVEQLADALERVLSDDDLRTSLIAAGVTQVASFSWTATADAMVRIYHELGSRDR